MHNPIERETYKQQLTSNETTLEVLKGYKPKLDSSPDFASMIVQLSAGHANAAWTLFEEADARVEREKRRYLLSGLESAAADHEDLQRGKTEIRLTFSEAGVFVLVSVSVCAAWRVRTGDDGDMALDGSLQLERSERSRCTVAAIAGRHPGRWPPEAQRSFPAAALLSQLPAALPPLNASPPLDEGEASSSEEDTKKSFERTGELRNFSIASVSSYGHVTNPGVNDPFEYGLPMPSLRERPSSEDLSVTMSLNVDDTFSCPDPPQRIRVASDTSSFYFKAPTQPSGSWKSNLSVSSQNPPISFYNYNRSFGNPALSENDTSTSGTSLAHQYATYGANGGLKAWVKHRQQSSVDSVMSDYSVGRLGRPGVGDKMFGTAMDRQPLRATSASPPESRGQLRNRSSYDSIIDEERRSSSMEDSVRVEKRMHTAFQDDDKGPNKARIVTKPFIASTSSSQFGGERKIRARQGLVRQSLEESCLIAEGEDLASRTLPPIPILTIISVRPAAVFTRPSPNSRSRSSTITTSSSGADTPPPLFARRGLIHVGQRRLAVEHRHTMTSRTDTPSRTRPRGRGHGHRRRYSARVSRSSVYETTQEERGSPATVRSKMSSSPTVHQGVFIVDPDAGSVDMRADGAGWDDERGIVALRRYYVLRHEAEDTVTESERTWSHTPFSVYALQAFQPPKNPEDMQALLQHSVRTTAHCRRSWDRAECARGPSRQAQRPSRMTPGESLRLSRPRPRGRPAPARAGAATPRLPIAAI
ncbi:hypothetical protein K438DRAFT_1759648 [Mycena galopus ATCC 62051]|nr:hypothetical protein K438DRAFT_1759648 [Mycena galopus ATCC 62051]